MVDWDLAGRTARRLIEPGPGDDAGGGRRRRPRTARGRRRRRRPRRGPDRPAPGARRPACPRSRSSTGRAGSTPTPRHVGAAQPAGRRARREAGTPPRARWPPRSARGPPACRPAACSPSCPRGCSASTRSSAPAAGCCWWRRTSWPPSASSASTRRDFRLWVCLHEVTHQLQFTAVPWLRGYLEGEVAALRRGHRPQPRRAAASGCRTCCAASADAVRGGGTATSRGADGARSATPRSARCSTGSPRVMSLVEGHAEYVMDGVGPRRRPVRAHAPQAVRPAPARAAARSTACCAGCSASSRR